LTTILRGNKVGVKKSFKGSQRREVEKFEEGRLKKEVKE
jgi:hypothetical protein